MGLAITEFMFYNYFNIGQNIYSIIVRWWLLWTHKRSNTPASTSSPITPVLSVSIAVWPPCHQFSGSRWIPQRRHHLPGGEPIFESIGSPKPPPFLWSETAVNGNQGSHGKNRAIHHRCAEDGPLPGSVLRDLRCLSQTFLTNGYSIFISLTYASILDLMPISISTTWPLPAYYHHVQSALRETTLMEGTASLHKRFEKSTLVNGMDLIEGGTTRELH